LRAVALNANNQELQRQGGREGGLVLHVKLINETPGQESDPINLSSGPSIFGIICASRV